MRVRVKIESFGYDLLVMYMLLLNVNMVCTMKKQGTIITIHILLPVFWLHLMIVISLAQLKQQVLPQPIRISED